MTDHSRTITIRGETLILLPEKMACWPARETLLVADTHFGKAATFRSHGIPVPEQTTHANLKRLSQAIEKCRAKRLIVLGDFIHSAIKNASTFEQSLVDWRETHSTLEIVLVRGNHDRGRADLFAKLNIHVVKEPFIVDPFALCHAGESVNDLSYYTIGGHVHPQIALDEGKKRLKLPCFWFGDRQGLLPAFGDFTGCATIYPEPGDQVFAVADSAVVPIDERAFSRRRV